MKAIEMQIGRRYMWTDPKNLGRDLGVTVRSISYTSKFTHYEPFIDGAYCGMTIEGDRMINVKSDADRMRAKGNDYDLPADWEVEDITH
tara:strand:+ start:615 stop:881 length:267 start_codon:yes stop_codon:yes gene_type:complete